jgi:hypothetical protein
MSKPLLSPWQIMNMNVGIFGIQFSFGLHQANLSPIDQMLGAEGKTLPLIYAPLLGGNPENDIRLAGVLLACAAVAVSFVKTESKS